MTRSRRRWGLLARDSDAPPTAVPRLRSAPLPVRLGILAVATNLVPLVLPLSLPLAAAAWRSVWSPAGARLPTAASRPVTPLPVRRSGESG
ncbi:hypothetical protein BH23ACT7_BH23ACT7_01240 [soil metagenome]|nr:hypothetical protein [Euzebyaceae bacterium]